MELLIIDRFEGDTAICETEAGDFEELDRALLPPGAREGDCLTPLPEGGFAVDHEETRRRRSANAALLRSLFEED